MDNPTPKVLYKLPQCAGQKFMPSNGTEGMAFTDAFCCNCIHEQWMHDPENDDAKKCEILTASMVEDEGPDEWQYNDEGWPVCTAWRKWDWGDDPNGLNSPPELPPDNPNQLVLPFETNEILKDHKTKETV